MIVDFTERAGRQLRPRQPGPDEPFGGGVPGVDFPVSDPATTGQVLQFRVVPAVGVDDSTPPRFLQLPAISPLPPETLTRRLALIEVAAEGQTEEEEEVESPGRGGSRHRRR